MSQELKTKQETVAEHRRHENDCGSSEVQIALLTKRINHLIEHLKQHKKDNHTRRGLIILVGKRKKLMKYLKRKDSELFVSVCKKLNLRIKD